MSGLPPLPVASRELRLPGFTLGHASDRERLTGLTVILCPEGAVAAADVRGSATGTRQFDALISPLHLATRAHGLVFAGGSGFGLGAADAVVAHLAAQGAGFKTGYGVVPLVPTAILFDLGVGDSGAYPTRALAEQAIAAAAAGPIATGSVGVGTAATVGKCRGLDSGMKGGFGFASLEVASGLTVAAAAAVNSHGDVRDPATDRIVAGCRSGPDSRELLGADRVLAQLPPANEHPWERNTTLVAVLTNAALSKLEALKVSQMAFGGLYRTLVPALSLYDGDLVVTLARGEIPAHVHQVAVLAERAVVEAILSAVRDAEAVDRLPAARDLAE